MTVVHRARPTERASTGSTSCCCRCRTPTPRCGRCSTSRASQEWPGARLRATQLLEGRRPLRLLRRPTARSPRMSIDLDPTSASTGFDRGAHLLVEHALAPLAPGGPDLRGRRHAIPRPRGSHLGAWCRAHGHRVDRDHDGATDTMIVVRGPAAVRRRRWVGTRRAPAARRRPRSMRGQAAARGGSRRAARWSRPAARAPRFDLDRARRRVGRHRAPALRAGRRRPVGSRDRDRLGRAEFDAARRGRGRGRAGHDVPDRERAGRARRAGPVPRPGPPALPRGRAAPRGPGGRRGPPHRGVHPASGAFGATTLGVSGAGGRASLADAARRARLRASRVPAVGAGRGHVPEPAVVPRAITRPTR